MNTFDLCIVGAGPTGCVIAERAATMLGWRVLLIEKRNHIGGNCYDELHPSGILIHRYGPHAFRTNSPELLQYLSAFTEWRDAAYIVKALHDGILYPFPINLTTLEKFFRCSLTPESAEHLLQSEREPILEPRNSEEFVLSRVGRKLYEAFYEGYSLKQWGVHPSLLDSSVCGRIPIRLNRDERYVDQAYQVMPVNGYTAMCAAMLDHPGITVQLSMDYLAVRDELPPVRCTVYTGPIDAYFDECLGKLPWRSLAHEYETVNAELAQPCFQINYPDERPYTRSVEFKYITGQQHPRTVVMREYPRAEGEPYYPVPMESSRELYRSYAALAGQETMNRNVHFCGRLARYTYINMDEAIEQALVVFRMLQERYAPAMAIPVPSNRH